MALPKVALDTVHGLGVVTNNERHFQRISDLHVENWLK